MGKFAVPTRGPAVRSPRHLVDVQSFQGAFRDSGIADRKLPDLLFSVTQQGYLNLADAGYSASHQQAVAAEG
ncbi:TPA: hypothetical protein ACH3X1_001159 [Trebouxia sp. C0004]